MDTTPLQENCDVDPDSNDWNPKESVFEFMNREYNRLLPKFPANFEARGFRISFIATTDKPEFPIETYFVVTVQVDEIGEVSRRGPNPFAITEALINSIHKEYANRHLRKGEEDRRRRREREEAIRVDDMRRLLLRIPSEVIGKMADGSIPLPQDVPMAMVEGRAESIAIEHVRRMPDSLLAIARPPAFLSQAEQHCFASRCEAETKSRSKLHEILNGHHKEWPAAKDDYERLLVLWELCARRAQTVEDVMFAFYYEDDSRPTEELTFERLLAEAPELIKAVRRSKSTAKRAAFQDRMKELEALRGKPDETRPHR